jgi:hypothetical protein
MRTSAYFMIALFVANLFTNQIFAQGIVINGNVVNSTTNERIQAVSVTVKDGVSGTFTDDKGSFRLPVEKLPVTLLISSAEFTSKEVVVEKQRRTAFRAIGAAQCIGRGGSCFCYKNGYPDPGIACLDRAG